MLHSLYLVKRSQALRGRNLKRDNQTDGASIVHRASDDESCQGPFLLPYLSNTGVMPQKIPGRGAEPHSVDPIADDNGITAYPTTACFHNACCVPSGISSCGGILSSSNAVSWEFARATCQDSGLLVS